MFDADNFEHKNERPWPNPYLDVAAIVGHTTATTCRLWLRAGRTGTFTLLCFPVPPKKKGKQPPILDILAQVPFDQTKLPNTVFKQAVSFSATKDTTAIVELDGLQPCTVYQYALADMTANPPKVLLGHDRTYQFRTLPEKEESTFSFAFYSCHMPYENSLFGTPQVVNIEMWEYLQEVLSRHQENGLRFVIAGGDQVYTDGIDSLDIWRFLNKCMRKEQGELFPDEAVMRGWYRDIYRGYWGFSQVRKVFSNYPMYMMWDDHELMDGWGSRYFLGSGKNKADETKRIFEKYSQRGFTYEDCHTLLARMESAGKAVYEEYQHGHNPTTASGVYDYGFQHDRSAFYVLDGRGHRDINRSSFRILGEAQFNRFQQWVEALDDSTKFLFVTAAVPVLHMSPALINQDDTWLARMEGLEDDLRDAWEHKLHDEERKALLNVLFAAAEREIAVCILSGDVHTAAAFRMKNKKSGAIMYQLTSSAITYNTPRALGWLLGGLVPDEGSSADGYDYERLARYTESNFSLIKVDQDKQQLTFQIYGPQKVEHPTKELVLPMTHSLAKLELAFQKD